MIGTLADWRAYASARGDNTPTEAEDAVATAALVRASDYIRFRYVANFISGYDETFIAPGYDIPLVEIGAYIAAGLELATPGLFSKTFTPAEQKVLTGVGSIRWTVTGKAGGIYAASQRSLKRCSGPTSSTATVISSCFGQSAQGPAPDG
jgi:hypothetical protein